MHNYERKEIRANSQWGTFSQLTFAFRGRIDPANILCVVENHNEYLYERTFYKKPHCGVSWLIIRSWKSKIMRLAKHVASIWMVMNWYRILVRKLKERDTGEPVLRREDNIMMVFKDQVYWWFHLSGSRQNPCGEFY